MRYLPKRFSALVALCLAASSFSPAYTVHAKTPDFQLMSKNKAQVTALPMSYQIQYSGNLAQDLEKASSITTGASLIHIAVPITSSKVDSSQWRNNLMLIQKKGLEATLSLIPQADVSEEDYLSACISFQKLTTQAKHLKTKGQTKGQTRGQTRGQFSNIVCYPRSVEALEKYKLDATWGVGVVIRQPEDLSLLDSIYKVVGDTKPLFIREEVIASTHPTATPLKRSSEVVKTLQKTYYTIATFYPQIDMIFSPYQQFNSTYPYAETYRALMSGDWLVPVSIEDNNLEAFASQALEVTTQAAFTVTKPYDSLTIGDPIFIWGNETALENVNCIQYTWNNTESIYQFTFPYPLIVAEDNLTQGINRLQIKAFDIAGKVLWSKQLDVQINGSEIAPRAPRSTPYYPKGQKPIYKTNYIPVLMYHMFVEEVRKGMEIIAVDTEVFDRQLALLLKEGYTPVTFYDLDLYLKGEGGLPDKPILITADDGYLDNYTHAFPILEKHKIPATFFVSTAYVGVDTAYSHFTWEEAKKMEASGLIDIQIHGYDHAAFTKLSPQDIRYQVSHSQGLLEKYLGKRDCVIVAYPQFQHTKESQAILAEMNIAFQITHLASKGISLDRKNVQRINVPSTMSPEALIASIQALTE